MRGAVPLSIGGRSGSSAGALIGACAYAALDVLLDEVPDAIDIVLPAVVLYAAPKRLGFGAYFAAWHAPRHLALLLLRDPRGGTYLARFARFAREAAPNAAIAAVFGAAAYWLRGANDRAEERVGAIILGITVPHQIAVWTIEFASRREGVRYS